MAGVIVATRARRVDRRAQIGRGLFALACRGPTRAARPLAGSVAPDPLGARRPPPASPASGIQWPASRFHQSPSARELTLPPTITGRPWQAESLISARLHSICFVAYFIIATPARSKHGASRDIEPRRQRQSWRCRRTSGAPPMLPAGQRRHRPCRLRRRPHTSSQQPAASSQRPAGTRNQISWQIGASSGRPLAHATRPIDLLPAPLSAQAAALCAPTPSHPIGPMPLRCICGQPRRATRAGQRAKASKQTARNASHPNVAAAHPRDTPTSRPTSPHPLPALISLQPAAKGPMRPKPNQTKSISTTQRVANLAFIAQSGLH